ncbi:hypothetical protein U1Q18_023196, partial [Sarracenia purpurea var. burkii]
MIKSSDQAAPFMAILLLLSTLLASKCLVSAITCGDVVRDIGPCVNYLTKSSSGLPPAACCAGAKSLASATTTTADKRAACNCMKSASQKVSVNPSLAKALPGNCGISLGFTVDPNIDCST